MSLTVPLKPLIGKLNESTRAALERAAGLCLSRTHYEVDIEHFLVALVESDDEIRVCVEHVGVNITLLQHNLQVSLDKFKTGNARNPTLSPWIVRLLSDAWLVASLNLEIDHITSRVVLVALLGDTDYSAEFPEISREFDKINVDMLLEEIRHSSKPKSSPAPVRSLSVTSASGPGVFLSYRRSEAESIAQTLFYCLIAQVERIRLFRDKDTLQPGMVFSEVIDRTIESCDIVVVLIGKTWLTVKDKNGLPRLEDETDWVRLEISAALRHKKVIVPCLINGARIPSSDQLPTELKQMASFHGIKISRDTLERDVQPLIARLKKFRCPT